MKKKDVNIKDPIHNTIIVDSSHKKFLDSKEFQRLRNIGQTSFSNFIYPSANHTRFSHSIGCYHLMGKLVNNDLNKIPAKDKNNLLIAALLHDIGHGPISHFWENLFSSYDHEKATWKMLEDMGLSDVVKILSGKSEYSLLISSTIDADKLDYMGRDSVSSGVSYGISDIEYIINHMYVEDGKLIIKKSAILSVEDLITQRVNLFRSVYFHRTVVGYGFLFQSIFLRVRELLNQNVDVSMNPYLRKFFDDDYEIGDVLKLNDHHIHVQIDEWSEFDDDILKDLCMRYLNRQNFKAVNLKYHKVNVRKIKKRVAEKYDVNYYFGHMKIPLNILQNPIYVKVDEKLVEIEKLSDILKFYKSQNWELEYLIIPKDISIE